MENNEKIENPSFYKQTIEMIEKNEKNMQELVSKLAQNADEKTHLFELLKLFHYHQNNQSLLLGIVINEIKDIKKYLCENKIKN